MVPREQRNEGVHFSRANQSLQTQKESDTGKLGSWEVGKQQGPGGRREASPGGQLPESTEGRFTPYHREPSELLAATTLPTSQLRCLYSTGAFILHQT